MRLVQVVHRRLDGIEIGACRCHIRRGVLNARSLPATQAKLPRAIQEKEVLPMGGTKPAEVDMYFIRAFRRCDGKVIPLEEQGRDYILWVLGEAHGNQTEAARMLGIDRGVDAVRYAHRILRLQNSFLIRL